MRIHLDLNLNNGYLIAGSVLLAGLLLILPACGGMRNVEKDSSRTRIVLDSSLSLQQIGKLKSVSVAESLFIKSDSLSNSYKVQIWPKGKFTFSAAKGFEGSADKIMLLATTRRGSETFSKRVLTKQTDQVLKTGLQKESHANTERVTKVLKKQVSWRTLLGYALIVCCLVGCFIIFRILSKPSPV
jgi:hypothetical protein